MSLARTLSRFGRSDDGLSAVEFALIAPILISMYFGAVEMCNLMIADRKVTNVCAATADLIAQAESISNGDMDNIFDAAAAIMEPFGTDDLEIIVTSVVSDDDGNTEIDWSDGYHADAHAEGGDYELPEGLIGDNESIIVTEVTYHYMPLFGMYMSEGVTVTDRFFNKPRKVIQVDRIS